MVVKYKGKSYLSGIVGEIRDKDNLFQLFMVRDNFSFDVTLIESNVNLYLMEDCRKEVYGLGYIQFL